MKVSIQSVGFTADKKLIDFTEKKLGKLSDYMDRIVEVEVFFRVENISDKENKITEVKVLVPGKDIVVKKQCKSFEEGVDLTQDVLKRQLIKYKEKVAAK
mgnify:CR=1 FL=1